MGALFLEYTPIGVHTRCSTLDFYKKLGGILTSITRLMLDFGPAHPCNLLSFLQIFSSHKLFVSTCSHMFFLGIILVEGSCFL